MIINRLYVGGRYAGFGNNAPRSFFYISPPAAGVPVQPSPGRSDLTGASESGADAEATQIPVSESIRDTFTDDVPMSYPSKYMVIGFVVRGCLIILVSQDLNNLFCQSPRPLSTDSVRIRFFLPSEPQLPSAFQPKSTPGDRQFLRDILFSILVFFKNLDVDGSLCKRVMSACVKPGEASWKSFNLKLSSVEKLLVLLWLSQAHRAPTV